MGLQTVFGEVELATIVASVARRAHKVPAQNVVAHAALAPDDLGANATPPGVAFEHVPGRLH